jgi:hypothetical protein
MKGGVKEIVLDFSKKQTVYVESVAAVLLLLGIVFPANIPWPIRKQASTVLGRFLIFAILLAILLNAKWAFGVLFAVFIAVLLSTRSVEEGFVSEFSFQMVNDNKRWFAEKVLDEHPVAIQDDRVKTEPVQTTTPTNQTSGQDSKSSR